LRENAILYGAAGAAGVVGVVALIFLEKISIANLISLGMGLSNTFGGWRATGAAGCSRVQQGAAGCSSMLLWQRKGSARAQSALGEDVGMWLQSGWLAAGWLAAGWLAGWLAAVWLAGGNPRPCCPL
jgi:hypothetical protein